jgi:hypothetical protein
MAQDNGEEKAHFAQRNQGWLPTNADKRRKDCFCGEIFSECTTYVEKERLLNEAN